MIKICNDIEQPQIELLQAGAAPVFSARSIEATHRIAAELAGALPLGSLIGLYGPLGAGKTEFVRGFAAAIGSAEQVASPTFVLEAIYPGFRDGLRFEIRHWDLYRLSQGDRSIELASGADLERSITLVEWPERVAAVEDLLSVKISIGFLEPQKDPEKERLLAALPETSPANGAPESETDLTQANQAAKWSNETEPVPRVISIELINHGETARRIGVFAQSLDRRS